MPRILSIIKKPQRTSEQKSNGYALAKKTCDAVMAAYPDPPYLGLLDTPESREASRIKVAAELSQTIAWYSEAPAKGSKKGQKGLGPRGVATRNPNSPSITDYKVDVDRAIAKVITSPAILKLFVLIHLLEGDITKISKEQQHQLARAEQQLGRYFLKHELNPRLYFISVRQPLRKHSQQVEQTERPALPKAA
jgi:hypothetical protein